MEERIIILGGILLVLGLFLWERHRRYALERKIDRLIHELDHFLLNGEICPVESLGEGRVENLRNQVAAVENQMKHRFRYWENQEKRMNQFVENMAHQMKTSLTALQIRVDLAQAKGIGPGGQEELEKCQESMARLTGEVDRILECSQLANQKIRMWPEPCDVKQLIQRVAAVLEPLWKKKDVELVLELSGISKITELSLDSYWFSQALENVVKNAIEHTPEGSRVWVTASDRIRSLALEVTDEGPGIPAGELPHLFERFHRGSYGKAGYGIGLSMARDILMAHHGIIQAGNRKGAGACFLLEVPILDGRRPYETVRE